MAIRFCAWTRIHPRMQAALAMYRKLGFREVVADPVEPVDGLIYMELQLGRE